MPDFVVSTFKENEIEAPPVLFDMSYHLLKQKL